MEALTQIPFVLDTAVLLDRAHLAQDSEDGTAFAALVDRAREVGRPKALYTEAFIETRGNDTVRIQGATFTSRILRRNLEGVERVFPHVATCGREMDGVPLPPGDVLAQFWWDLIKTELLSAALAHLSAHLTERFRLGQTSRWQTWQVRKSCSVGKKMPETVLLGIIRQLSVKTTPM